MSGAEAFSLDGLILLFCVAMVAIAADEIRATYRLRSLDTALEKSKHMLDHIAADIRAELAAKTASLTPAADLPLVCEIIQQRIDAGEIVRFPFIRQGQLVTGTILKQQAFEGNGEPGVVFTLHLPSGDCTRLVSADLLENSARLVRDDEYWVVQGINGNGSVQ